MPQDDRTELFYWVDEDDQELGSITRAEAHSGSKKIHRAVAILVQNPEGTKVLLQKRSEQKDMDPGLWSYSVGGHVQYGKEYQETAEREMVEELGIGAPLTLVMKRLEIVEDEREYTTFFLATVSEETPLTLDPYEISETRWVKVKDLKSFIEHNQVASSTVEALSATGYL